MNSIKGDNMTDPDCDFSWVDKLFGIKPFKYEDKDSKPRYTLVRSSDPTKLMCYRTYWKYRENDPDYKSIEFIGYIDK